MAKVTAMTKATIKKGGRSPIKAGSTMPRNIGGAVNAKLVATVRKKNG